MKCIRSHSKDPFFNLAAEEFLLKNYDSDFYFQYVNDASVIVGKHQNAIAEIDLEYLNENNIILARRISGGGAVFHDQGNLNYSFITNESEGNYIRFKKYTSPLISALKEIGVQAHLGKRNEILAGDLKISGTASHVFKSRALHHGTLLFQADLERLAKCLYVSRERYSDKAVKSVRSAVVNISELMEDNISMQEFSGYIFSYILNSEPENSAYHFSSEEILEIEKQRDAKFSTWEWNLGYSPKYIVEQESEGKLYTTMVNKGVIEDILIDGRADGESERMQELLRGVHHDKIAVRTKLSAAGFTDSFINKTLKNLF